MSIDLIRSYIQDEILNDASVQLAADQDLLLSEALDSLGVMRLVAYLESEFGIEIPTEDVTLENFSTLDLITTYVAQRGS
jgi:acyl carrier protein